jgi:hypothetical protein
VIETFERFGTKSNWVARQLKTILLKDVTKDESIITDHIWSTCGIIDWIGGEFIFNKYFFQSSLI